MIPFVIYDAGEHIGKVLVNQTGPLVWGIGFIEEIDGVIRQAAVPMMGGLYKCQLIMQGKEVDGDLGVSCANIAIVPADTRSDNLYQMDMHTFQFRFIHRGCEIVKKLKDERPEIFERLREQSAKDSPVFSPPPQDGGLILGLE